MSDDSSIDEDERKTNSDIHEMFFVNELMKDDIKFEMLLLKQKTCRKLSGSESDDDTLKSLS